jgi:hypothetical protein
MQKPAKLALVLGLGFLTLTPTLAQAFLPNASDGTSNDPAAMDPNYIREAGVLNTILKSSLPPQKMPASDDYWADFQNGIAFRWNDGGLSSYSTNSKGDIQNMTRADLMKLSPSEKFDLAEGDYSFSLTKTVKAQSNDNGADRQWEGICHGWTSSGINNTEPMPVDVLNPDGISIPFGASDVKALLSYSYTSRAKVKNKLVFGIPVSVFGGENSGYQNPRQVGGRCGNTDFSGGVPTDCQDVDAGAFHIVLLNQIAQQQKAFIADIDNTIQVWNQPITGYQILDIVDAPIYASATPGTVKVQKVQIIMEYVAEINPQWEPVVGTAKQRIEGMAYEYYIDIDAAGMIIGGTWLRHGNPASKVLADGTATFETTFAWKTITGTQAREHPDFLWTVDPAPRLGIWKDFMDKVYKPRTF